MNLNRFLVLLITFLFLFSCGISAQTNSKLSQADEYLKAGEVAKAEKLYKEVIEEEPGNNLAVYKIAAFYQSQKNFPEAINYYSKLAPNGNPTVLYNLACAYSMNGDSEKALNSLQTAVDKGFNQINYLKTDTDLENIRDTEKFNKIMRSIKVLENYPEAEKFDFWVGEWDVYNQQGQKAGESKIEKILKGAVILENWFGGKGFVGKSFNHFNMDKNKWVQYWVNEKSGSTYFEGNYDESQHAVVFYSFDHAKDDNPFIRKLTFFNLGPDEVRQFAQRSVDDGKTWNTEYDFIYKRKN